MAFASPLKPKSNPSNLKGFRAAAFASLGNLIKLLPTGTVFMFQFLNPLATDNGHCKDTFNENLSRLLIAVCGLSCAFSCFTDSYTGSDDAVHYSIATFKGLWPSPASELVDLSKYKIRIGDFVHALLSTLVFVVVTLLDPNTIECLCSWIKKDQQVWLKTLPPAVGVISSVVFAVFPSKRHGIGYPFSSEETIDPIDSKEVE